MDVEKKEFLMRELVIVGVLVVLFYGLVSSSTAGTQHQHMAIAGVFGVIGAAMLLSTMDKKK